MKTACSLTVVLFLSLASTPILAAQEASHPADAAAQREDQVRRRVLTDFRDEATAARTAISALRDNVQRFSTESKDLLKNDAGKRIAHDLTAVMTFIQIRDDPMPSTDEIAKKLQMVEGVLKDIDSKLARPRVEDLPSTQQKMDVLNAYAWASARVDRVSDRTDSLKALIASVPSDADVSKAPTLETAITEYKSRFSRFLNEGWHQGESNAADRAKQTMTDAGERSSLEQAAQKARIELEKVRAENERLKAEHEAELRRLREQQDQRIADMDRELAVAKAARLKQQAETTVIEKKGEEDAAKVLKRKQCEDPEVKALLAPFLAPGYFQPGRPMTQTVDKQPVSLKALRSYGALDRTIQGLGILTDVLRRSGNDNFPDPDRPGISFGAPYGGLNGDDKEKVKKIQGLLNDLGDTLVEMKMLSP